MLGKESEGRRDWLGAQLRYCRLDCAMLAAVGPTRSHLPRSFPPLQDIKLADRGMVWNTDLVEAVELENLLMNAAITMWASPPLPLSPPRPFSPPGPLQLCPGRSARGLAAGSADAGLGQLHTEGGKQGLLSASGTRSDAKGSHAALCNTVPMRTPHLPAGIRRSSARSRAEHTPARTSQSATTRTG